ncbi:MAG TPA: hypothetical protein VK803_07970 [Steroidobacteraceae bacterium]|jgi:hypothetical protein|nr:hypothetical protein [Steroidobacteraceae bacterium]
MTDFRDREQAALAKLNQDRTWIVANRAWLIAIAAAAVIGFILAKIF